MTIELSTRHDHGEEAKPYSARRGGGLMPKTTTMLLSDVMAYG